MRVIRDMVSGNVTPVPFDIMYNGDLAVDSVTKRYKGSLVKFMDYDDIDHGRFATFAGLATAMESLCGILEEEQGITDNYLPDDATYGMRYKKITPIFPSSVIEAEYSQYDAAGTSNVVASGITGTSGTTALAATITTNDVLIGGWIYFLTGACAGFLSMITDNSTTAITLANALPAAVVTTDDCLIICPPNARKVDFDATYSSIKSQVDDGSWADFIVGISTWIDAPGIGKTKLDRDSHSGLVITGARFYHQFVIPSYSTLLNAWVGGIYST